VVKALGVDRGLRILGKVMRRLASEADRFRHNRDPDDPRHFCFRQPALARDLGGWFDCVILVNDRTTATCHRQRILRVSSHRTAGESPRVSAAPIRLAQLSPIC
jgi:hypothetical protein